MNKYKIEIKWAILFSIMMLCWMILERLLGFHDKHIDKHAIVTNFIAIPAILLFVLALLDKKRNFYNGHMSYKQGFISGLILSVFIGILSPLIQYITSTIITPQYFNNAIQYSVSNGLMTQAAADAAFNLKNYLIMSLIGSPIMGIVTTAIVAFFVKSKK